jgi:hypothetical protein
MANIETPRPKGRFIAGAVCPRCGEMDRIIVAPDGETRSCVACDYTDARPEDTTQPNLPATRVERPAARLTETPAQVVKFIDLPKDDA